MQSPCALGGLDPGQAQSQTEGNGRDKMLNQEKKNLVEALEKALQNARNDAAGYADMGQTEDSIHADGVAEGLQLALELVRKTTNKSWLSWEQRYQTFSPD